MNTKGGVAPLKKRGGKAARQVTAKKTGKGLVSGYKGRGGFKKSKGSTVNPAGYNVHTRFKPRAKPTAPAGGGTTEPTSNKPYSFDEQGKIVIQNYNIQNAAGGTKNENININKNINTNTNNVEKENDKIKENNDKLSGYEYRETGGKKVKKEQTSTKYGAIWDSYREGHTKTYGERYSTTGQKLRFDPNSKEAKEHLKDHLGRVKGGYIIHNNLEEYANFMLAFEKYKAAGGKKFTSKSTRKKYTYETIDGKKQRRSYDEVDGTRTYTSDWEDY